MWPINCSGLLILIVLPVEIKHLRCQRVFLYSAMGWVVDSVSSATHNVWAGT